MKNAVPKIVWALTGLLFVALGIRSGCLRKDKVSSDKMGRQQASLEADNSCQRYCVPDTAARGKSMSMATGFIDRNRTLEGLFVLDHLSGLLQCWVVNPRTGNIAGLYYTDVNEHLELKKGWRKRLRDDDG